MIGDLRATTPVNIEQLQKELQNYPDPNFANFLISGLSYGFDTGISSLPDKSIECKNLLSARKNPEFVSEALRSEVMNGYMNGPFEMSPFDLYRVNPLGWQKGNIQERNV